MTCPGNRNPFTKKLRGRPSKYGFLGEMKIGDTRILHRLSGGSTRNKYMQVYMAIRNFKKRFEYNREFRIEMGSDPDRHVCARITRIK